MRYVNQLDAQMMRRRAMDPSILMRRRQLAGLTSAVSGAAGLINIGHGSTLTSAASGASSGMSIGSIYGPVGMAIGALVGGAVGAIASAFNRQDQEVQNFDQAQAIVKQAGPAAVINIANKYLVLAGLFDLETHQIKGNIPFVKKYGRFGELAFTMAMCQLIQQAANSGVITDNDTPQTVYSKVVLPWINGMGYGAFADSNADMLGYILMGMIAEYCAGVFSQRWYARGGDMPFGSLAPFTLPKPTTPVQPQVTASPTPSPQPVVNQSPLPASQVSQVPPELQRYMNSQMPVQGVTIGYAFNGSTFLQLPPNLTFQGVDGTTRAWIVQDGSGQQYELQGSTLQPIQKPTPAVSAVVNPPTQSSGGASATDPAGASIPTQYIPAGGGGGGPLLPVSNSSVPIPVASNFTISEIGIGALVLLGVMYMMTQRHS